jgi:DNA-binding transcriptional LysR family regulator
MDLRQLRYFVAVAEELHFTRAAARLHLAQSALSSQVRQLEDEIGGELLIRSKRRVQLTPAGAALLEDGREILAAAEEAMNRTRALARGDGSTLVLGSLGSAPGGLLAPLLAQFNARHPNTSIALRAFDFNQAVRGLREGRADIAFLYGPLDEPDLLVTPLLSEQRVVVLPSSHRLAARSELRPLDLADETFVTQPLSISPEWRDFWLLTDQIGHQPPVSPQVGENIEEWLHLIGRGEGVDTAPAIISRYYSWPDVTFVPLAEAPPATLVLARWSESSHRLAEEFVEIAREVASIAAANADTPYSNPRP